MKKLSGIEQIDFYHKVALDNPLWGKPIAELFPIHFEKYCKIFHKCRLSPDPKCAKENVWDLNDENVMKYVNGEHAEHNKALQEYLFKPVKLLAEYYNEPFDKHFNTDKIARHWKKNQPKWFLCPDTGTLDEKTCEALIEILKTFTKENDCYFHYTFYAINTYEETIYKGKLSEMNETWELGRKGTPTNIWSETKNWFISTPYDADFSIMAGERKIIDCVLANKEIDAYEFEKDEILIPYYLENS